MSDNKQIYLKEAEVEHVISALSGNTSARDLAEAIGRSEAEVIAVIEEMRKDQQPPSEIELLREQNALLQKQIDELKASHGAFDKRARIRIFAAAAAMLMLILGVWTMSIATQVRAATPAPPAIEGTTGLTTMTGSAVSEVPPDAFTPSPTPSETSEAIPPPAAGTPTAP